MNGHGSSVHTRVFILPYIYNIFIILQVYNSVHFVYCTKKKEEGIQLMKIPGYRCNPVSHVLWYFFPTGYCVVYISSQAQYVNSKQQE